MKNIWKKAGLLLFVIQFGMLVTVTVSAMPLRTQPMQMRENRIRQDPIRPGMQRDQSMQMRQDGLRFEPANGQQNLQPFTPVERNLPEIQVPQGNTKNPSLNRNIFNETNREGVLTRSTDYAYVYLLGNISDREYADFSSYMSVLVSQQGELAGTFRSDGWRIILTSADLDQMLFGGNTQNVVGCTISSEKTIYVEAGASSYCVIHEFGHYLDYKLSEISKGNEFQTIYGAEAGNLSSYGQTDATEFFAEIYMYGILEPQNTQEKCPLAYAFVENCKNSF